ncbi:MAG TPA: chemotaxis protein CheW, partial [Burkholderiaceae bacterium]|nr:chemotaxis protein CheW [Burkholderiaceae bacterium]
MTPQPGSAAQLRRAFDESFGRPGDVRAERSADYLAIRLRGDPHALRQAEIARLLRLPRLTRYPAPAAAWLGLAGIAGAVVPVYDLGVLAGYAPTPSVTWGVLCAAAPVAFAFDAFDGHFRLAHAGLEAEGSSDLLYLAGESRPVLSLA